LAHFVDSSALYAILDASDTHHEEALTFAASMPAGDLLTHSYVVVEAVSLAHRRLSFAHVRQLLEELLPALPIRWITEDVHRAAVSAMVEAARRSVSLVDWVSFEIMRREGIDTAFAFDRDFAGQGFRVVP
jgi:predicted nucleic acid-binding protein